MLIEEPERELLARRGQVGEQIRLLSRVFRAWLCGLLDNGGKRLGIAAGVGTDDPGMLVKQIGVVGDPGPRSDVLTEQVAIPALL